MQILFIGKGMFKDSSTDHEITVTVDIDAFVVKKASTVIVTNVHVR